MSVAKPGTVPRWASASPSTSTVTPPASLAAINAWAPGAVTPGLLVMQTGVEYVVISIAGTGTSTTGPTGTGVTVDNPGANQVTWGYVSAVPTTQDSGFQPNTQPPAQYFNWLFYWVYLWVLWIQDLANQNFTGSGTNPVGPWTGQHTFSAPVSFTGGTSGSGPLPPLTSTAKAGSGQMGGNFTGDGSGDGIDANGGSTPTSGGNGITAFGGSSGAGGAFYGGYVPSGGGSAGPGLTCTGGSDGTSNGQPGAICNGGLGNAVGCQGNGTGTAAGVVGTATTATAGAGAVTGVNFGAGPGVYGASTTGPGVLGQSSSAGAAIQGVSSLGTPCGQFFNTYSGGGIGITCTTLTGIAGFFENTGNGGTATQATSNSDTTATSTVANTGAGDALDANATVGNAVKATVTSGNAIDAAATSGTAVVANATTGEAIQAAVTSYLGACIKIVQGLLAFSGTQPGNTDTIPANSFSADHLPKAKGVFTCAGGGTSTAITTNRALNCAMTMASNGLSVAVTFGTNMADGFYHVDARYENTGDSFVQVVTNKTLSGFTLAFQFVLGTPGSIQDLRIPTAAVITLVVHAWQ